VRSRKGRVESAQALVEGRRLRVRLSVLAEGEGPLGAYLPEREVAALLPRGALLGRGVEAPRGLLRTLQAILVRQVVGRTVRLWSYQERSYASFLPWRGVRFEEEGEEEPGGEVPSAGLRALRVGGAGSPDNRSRPA
jgi:hypothetical protein